MSTNPNSFNARATWTCNGADYTIYRLAALPGAAHLPYSLKILLENLLRTEDGANITADHINALASWDAGADPSIDIQFTPARVLMQDFTGVPCIVDLAAMREAVAELGGEPSAVNPLAPAELVIDHSVIADHYGTQAAYELNVGLEYERNRERYQFLRWGQTAFSEFKVVPPGTGIVHQVNIEHLARVVMVRDGKAYPDTVVGTDSHTTMVNGLGVLGWGVDADSSRRRLQAHWPIARGHHRHRLGARHHADAAQARRGRQVRRVLRRIRCRSLCCQPQHHRQHEPGVRLDLRNLPDR